MTMSTLRVHKKTDVTEITFSGRTRLRELLEAHGLMPDMPCAGNGTCGKCYGYLDTEKVLTCQAWVDKDADLYLHEKKILSKIKTDGEMPSFDIADQSGYGIAVDIGTTTVVLRIVDLKTGQILPAVSIENPQRTLSADVIGRIQQCVDNGKLPVLHGLITETIENLKEHALKQSGLKESDIVKTVVTGNTTMLYLLTGRDPATEYTTRTASAPSSGRTFTQPSRPAASSIKKKLPFS